MNDEFPKTLRSLHGLTVLVGAAVIVVCITSHQATELEEALAEVKTLTRVSWGDYGTFALKILDSQLKPKLNEAVVADYQSVFRKNYRLTFESGFSGKLLPFVQIPAEGSTLGDYRKFFTGTNLIGYYRSASAADAASIVTTDFDRPQAAPDDFSKQATLYLVDVELLAKSYNYRLLKLASGDEILTAPIPENQSQAIHRLYYTVPTNSTLHNRLFLGKISLVSQVGNFAKQWLLVSHADLSQSSDGASATALPHTQRFHTQIDSLPLAEAVQFLEKKLEEKRQNFSFLGQSYTSNLVGLIAPTLLLGLLGHFAVQQRGFISHWMRMENIAEIATFPWIGFFSDRLSSFAFGMSIAGVPTLAVVLCLVFLVDFYSLLAGYTLGILACICFLAVVVLRQSHVIRVVLRRSLQADESTVTPPNTGPAADA